MKATGKKSQRAAKGAGRDISAMQRTRQAYREILRLIHSTGMEPGDMLPKQSELLDMLSMCQGTVSSAMKWLVEDEVVVRKKAAGTTVVNLFPLNKRRLIWTVGLVMPDAYKTPFFPTLTHFLHKHLALNACADRVYILSPHAPPRDEVDKRFAADFSGLAEDLQAGLLDAIITPTRLTDQEIPVCGAMGPGNAKIGVMFDKTAMVQEAAGLLFRKACKRVSLVVSDTTGGQVGPEWNGFVQAHSQQGLPTSQDRQYIRVEDGLNGGQSLAEILASMPPEERPDGLVITDDIVAQSMTANLQGSGLNYRPEIAVQTNKQAPVAFAMPVYHFDLDMESLAERCVQKALQALLVPSTPPSTDWLRFHLHSEEPSVLVAYS